MSGEKRCHHCGGHIPPRAYQSPTARACRPACAAELFRAENPDWKAKFERVLPWEKLS